MIFATNGVGMGSRHHIRSLLSSNPCHFNSDQKNYLENINTFTLINLYKITHNILPHKAGILTVNMSEKNREQQFKNMAKKLQVEQISTQIKTGFINGNSWIYWFYKTETNLEDMMRNKDLINIKWLIKDLSE